MALGYAEHHKTMANPNRPGCDLDGFNFGKQGGITNGAAWYSVQGGKQIVTKYMNIKMLNVFTRKQ